MADFDKRDADMRKVDSEMRKFDTRLRLSIADGMRECVKSPNGRAFIWNILKISHAVGSNPYRHDDAATNFACGEMNVGLQILAQLNEVAPDFYLIMIKENADAERTRRNAAGCITDSAPDFFDNGTSEDA